MVFRWCVDWPFMTDPYGPLVHLLAMLLVALLYAACCCCYMWPNCLREFHVKCVQMAFHGPRCTHLYVIVGRVDLLFIVN